MWAREDVCELFAQNVSPFAENLGPRAVLFAANVGRIERRLWARRITFVGRYRYREELFSVSLMEAVLLLPYAPHGTVVNGPPAA